MERSSALVAALLGAITAVALAISSTASQVAALPPDDDPPDIEPRATSSPDPMRASSPDPTPGPLIGRLAFTRDGDLWVIDVPSGEAQRLTHDGINEQPLWSPSRERIAFRKRTGPPFDELWVIGRSGAGGRVLTGSAPQGTWRPWVAWSPVDDRLAYITAEGTLQTLHPSRTLVRRSLQPLPALGPGFLSPGGRIDPSTFPDRDRATALAWSPDGEWIAYQRDSPAPTEPVQGIFRVRADESDDTAVYVNLDPAMTQSHLAGWSPDGQLVLFWQGRGMSASELAGGPPLMAIPSTGGEPSEIASGVLFRHPTDVLAWSPDASQLVAVQGANREAWDNKTLAIGSPGARPTAMAQDGQAQFFPSWSPDGSTLAFASGPAAPNATGGDDARRALDERHIWTMKADGSNERQLTTDARYRDERPMWLADGEHILFARLVDDERSQVWLMRSDGSEQQKLVEDLGPIPTSLSSVWFGYYGYIDWFRYYDWWQAPPHAEAPPDVQTIEQIVRQRLSRIYGVAPMEGARLSARRSEHGWMVVVDRGRANPRCADLVSECSPYATGDRFYVCVDQFGQPTGRIEGWTYPRNLPEKDRCSPRPPPRVIPYHPQPGGPWATYVERRPNHEPFSIQYPAGWQPVDSFECCPRFRGEDGSLFLNWGIDAHSIEDACMVWADHKALSFGTDPTIEVVQVDGREACFLWPSRNRLSASSHPTAMLVVSGPTRVGGFLLYVDAAHVEAIAATLKF